MSNSTRLLIAAALASLPFAVCAGLAQSGFVAGRPFHGTKTPTSPTAPGRSGAVQLPPGGSMSGNEVDFSGPATAAQPAPHTFDASPSSLLAQPATPATVDLVQDQLTIHATNSSLRAILDTYASLSGTKVSGVAKDERIFGSYGPGTPQEVLSSLLDDSGYNVVIAGQQPDGAPREVNLSLQTATDTAPQPTTLTQAAQADEDDDAPTSSPFAAFQQADEPPPSATPPDRPSTPAGQQARTPQQMLQELQQIRQQQQQQQQPPQ